jgi:GH24 family phage-related lysozyme (muramidase)
MTTITYGAHTIDTATLPEVSILSLISKGLAHFLGNEQASKVTRWKKDNESADEAAVAATLAQYQADALVQLAEGKVGIHASRPRGSALETIMREIAEKEVRMVLKQSNLTMPSGDKKLTFADGTELTRQDLLSRRLAHATHGPRIKALAEKELAARERNATKAMEAAGGNLAEALGL